MKSAVVVLPGLNRDRDMIAALTKISGKVPVTVWQTDTEIPDVDLVVIPGGFSYGDYLRCGAIAARMPVMRAVAEKAEKGLTDVIARLERARLAEEERRRAAGGAVAEGTISTRDLGSLTWPVDGTLIYRFGPVRKPSGVTLVNKGIGIAAPAGTPVKAVEGGLVSIARSLEGYGTTVMLDHGGGYYTLYMFLKSLAVREGQRVVVGQVVGAVGGEQTPEGAHLFFQVRAPAQGQVPAPVDPLTWLQSRAAAR